MKKIKDLMCLNIDENNIENIENEENIEEDKETREEILNNTTKEQVEENNDEKKQKNESSPIRRYFKYEDGKIKYIKKTFKATGEEELSFKEMKDDLNKEVKTRKKYFDKKSFVNKLLIIFIIFSVIFVYFYYIKDNHVSNNEFQSKEETVNEINNNVNRENYEIETKKNTSIENNNLTKEEIEEKIVSSVRNDNTNEIKKVQNYIDIKGNRVSTTSLIRKNKKNKEDLYAYLVQNQALFKKDQDSYFEIEDLLIKSIAMSEEFLIAFNNNSSNAKLQEIIDYYLD